MARSDAPKKTKTLLGVVVGVLFFFLAYYAVQHLINKPSAFDEKMLTAAAIEVNKTCPMIVDQYTRLDNAIALPNNVFQYNYTLLNITKAEVNLDTVTKYVEPGVINGVRTNPDMKVFRDNKVTVNYNYKDKDGVFVLAISVTPDMYAGE